ncbi:MAG: hypothetical protein ACTHQM_23985 [Thermoanaerobaculia bacterium]
MSVTETQPERRLVLPAEYYSSETPRPILPSWVKYGCGGLSLFVLIVVFAGGAWLAGGGMVDFMDLVFGMSMGEMRPLLTKDVTDAQKQTLEKEIETLRANLRERRITVQQLDPMLQAMRRATSDTKVTPAEVEEMTAAARKLNAAKPPKTQ